MDIFSSKTSKIKLRNSKDKNNVIFSKPYPSKKVRLFILLSLEEKNNPLTSRYFVKNSPEFPEKLKKKLKLNILLTEIS